MKLTREQKYAAGAGALGVIGLLWYFWPKKTSPARMVKTLEIDADVYSPTFGLPVGAVAENPEMQRLIDESNAAIARANEGE